MCWTHQAVIYNIFVDRFARGRSDGHTRGVVRWGSVPTRHNFMGGDLRGIVDRLDYLQNLGVNTLALTPIFKSSSNHRYNTYDYYQIDPRIGGLTDFHRLVDQAHHRGMRLILDGVFNHCGRGFYPFFDVMENGAESPYCDWFSIDAFPVDAYGNHRYRAWLNAPVMPEFNLANPHARRYLLDVAKFWTGQGIDGWRLDAVPHVQHSDFWLDLGRTIKGVNPQAYLLAEIWSDARPWLIPGYFDGATNYPLRERIFQFVLERSIGPASFAACLNELVSRHSWKQTLAMCNLLGSHDTVRLWTVAEGNLEKIKLAWLLLFFFPGIPAVYYGDESGLAGGKDPDNRRAMEWRGQEGEHELAGYLKRLITARTTYSCLQDGQWETVLADDQRDLCAFLRRGRDRWAILVVCRVREKRAITINLKDKSLPDQASLPDLAGASGRYRARDGILEIDAAHPHSGLLLVLDPRAEAIAEVAVA